MRAVPWLVWARFRHRPGSWLVVILGVAVAVAMPVLAAASAVVVSAAALAHGVAELPAGQRSLIVSYPGVSILPSELDPMDQHVAHSLAQLSSGPLTRQVLFRRLADGHGGTYFLGAADDLAQHVRLESGRLPASCTPTRCEVLDVGPGAAPRLDPSLGLVVVGTGIRTDPLLLTGTFDPGHDAPLLLADGVQKVAALDSLDQFQRSYGWAAPLDLDRVQALGVDDYLARSAAVSAELGAWKAGLVLTAPDDVIRSEQARAQLSSRRFALLAGSAIALLLGFAVIAAVGRRRDHGQLVDLMRQRGATRRTVLTLTAVEAVVPVLLATVLGLLVGWVAALVVGARAGLPAASTAADALGRALPQVLVSALLAAIVVALTLGWSDRIAQRAAWRVVDAVIVVALVMAVLAASRGAVSAGELGTGSDPLLLTLPVLAVLAGGLLAGRIWPWLARTAERAVPARRLGARIALLGGLRHPLRPVATVAFVAAATALVVFSGAYRSTLAQGAADQAAFQVPLDARVVTGSTLQRPLDVAEPAAYAGLAPGVTVHGVVRSAAAVQVSAAQAEPVELVGVDPAALTSAPSWDHDAGGSAAAARDAITTANRTLAGITVPAGTRRLAFAATGDVEQVQLVAWMRLADGRDVGTSLALTAGPAAGAEFVGAVPAAGAAGGTLFSFTMAESVSYATHHQHAIGEGNVDVALLAGSVVLSLPSFDGAPAAATSPPGWTGWGSTGANVSLVPASSGQQLTVAYRFSGALVVVRAGASVPELPIPALVDPATAALAQGATLEAGTPGSAPITLAVAGVLPRFPTSGASFAVVDGAALANALDARDPGTGGVSELWIAAPPASVAALDAALAAPPYDQLTVTTRAAVEAQLRSDPLARGAVALLAGSAALGLVVALLALVLLVLSERRDSAAELYAWESDGVAPATLRVSLFVRALSVVLVAVPMGLLTGILLSRATTSLVTVTAVGTTPQPPLVLSVGPGWIGALLGMGLLVAVVSVALLAFSALREPLPRRPEVTAR